MTPLVNRCGSIVWTLWFCTALLGCSTTSQYEANPDPLEKFNRASYRFNDKLDQYILKPVADTYVKITPRPLQTGVSNFFDNLGEINVALNSFLQGKIGQGFSDSGRFITNTTIGLLGFFDVATKLGLEKHQEDFGQTLAVWGVGEGPYIVYPFFGPSTMRDTPGIVVTTVTNPMFYIEDDLTRFSFYSASFIDLRARLDNAVKLREQAALDPYVFTREAYLQRRTYLIHDGNPPPPDYDELFEDDYEE